MQRFWLRAALFQLFFSYPCLGAEINRQVLKNGLILVTIPKRDIPIVHATYLWDVGSSDETSSTLGMAHLMEHMMFNGTAKYPGQSFDQLLEAQGGRTNAATTREQTIYEAWLPSDALTLLHELENDRIRSSKVDDQVLQNEKKVILAENAQNLAIDPFETIYRRLNEALFGSESLAHPILGSESSIKGWTKEGLEGFRDRFYRPARLTVILSGDIEVAAAVRALETIPATGDRLKPACGHRQGTASTKGIWTKAEQGQHVGLAFRTVGLEDRDIFSLRLLKKMIEMDHESSLTTRLAMSQKLQNLQVDFDAFRCQGAFFLYADSIATRKGAEGLSLLEKEWRAFIGQPNLEALLRAAQSSLRQDLSSRSETREGRSKLWQEHHLSIPDLANFDQIVERYADVGIEDLNRSIKLNFK